MTVQPSRLRSACASSLNTTHRRDNAFQIGGSCHITPTCFLITVRFRITGAMVSFHCYISANDMNLVDPNSPNCNDTVRRLSFYLQGARNTLPANLISWVNWQRSLFGVPFLCSHGSGEGSSRELFQVEREKQPRKECVTQLL